MPASWPGSRSFRIRPGPGGLPAQPLDRLDAPPLRVVREDAEDTSNKEIRPFLPEDTSAFGPDTGKPPQGVEIEGHKPQGQSDRRGMAQQTGEVEHDRGDRPAQSRWSVGGSGALVGQGRQDAEQHRATKDSPGTRPRRRSPSATGGRRRRPSRAGRRYVRQPASPRAWPCTRAGRRVRRGPRRRPRGAAGLSCGRPAGRTPEGVFHAVEHPGQGLIDAQMKRRPGPGDAGPAKPPVVRVRQEVLGIVPGQKPLPSTGPNAPSAARTSTLEITNVGSPWDRAAIQVLAGPTSRADRGRLPVVGRHRAESATAGAAARASTPSPDGRRRGRAGHLDHDQRRPGRSPGGSSSARPRVVSDSMSWGRGTR